MRILIINDTADPHGGTEVSIISLAGLLQKYGHQVAVFGGTGFGNRLSFIKRFYDPVAFFRAFRIMREFSPDIIHCHNISRNISPAPLHAAKRLRIPVVMTVHDYHLICPRTWFIDTTGNQCRYGFGLGCLYHNCLTYKRGLLYFPYHWAKMMKVLLHRRIITRNVSAFIAVSGSLGEWMHRNLAIRQVEILPSFVDISEIESDQIRQTREVLYIGRLSAEKGINILIDAMSKVLKVIPEARLTVVGSGPERQELEALAGSLGLGEAVEFIGYVPHDKIGEYYRKAQVVVVPSVASEGFPTVCIEATAYGRPLIVTDAFGLPEAIGHNENGFLFDLNTPDDLADRLVDILTDFNLTIRMSQTSLAMARERYSEKEYYERLMGLYEGVSGKAI